MRFLTLCAILLCLCNTLFSQNERRKAPFNSFGFDATSVLRNVLSQNPGEDAPYSLVWKKALTEKKGWRVGLSFIVTNVEEDNNGNFNFRSIDRQGISLRLGREYFYWLTRRFHFFYGWDVIGGFDREVSEVIDFNFGQIRLETLQWQAGLGPVIGLEYQFNKLIKIGVESTLYAMYYRGTRIVEDSLGTDEKTNTSGYSLRHVLPQSLYLYILF